MEKAAVALERVARSAPDPQAAGMATEAAGALRGLAFAVEADRLLRQGASAPTGVQLAQADEARRARNSELSAALAQAVHPHRGAAPLPRRPLTGAARSRSALVRVPVHHAAHVARRPTGR